MAIVAGKLTLAIQESESADALAITRFTSFSIDRTLNTFDFTNQGSAGFMEKGGSTKGLTISFDLVLNQVAPPAGELGYTKLAELFSRQSGTDNNVIITLTPQSGVSFVTLTARALITGISTSATHHEHLTASVTLESTGEFMEAIPA